MLYNKNVNARQSYDYRNSSLYSIGIVNNSFGIAQ